MEQTPASLIVLLPPLAIIIELISYTVFKDKISRVVTLEISPRRSKILRGPSHLELYSAYNRLTDKKFLEMKLKLHASSAKSNISLFISTIHSMFPIFLAIISIIALFTTTINNKLELTLSELIDFYRNDLDLVSFILIFYIVLAFTHLILTMLNARKKRFIKIHLTVINELEKENPVTVCLSEDQYQALSSSSGFQRNIYRFGQYKNHN